MENEDLHDLLFNPGGGMQQQNLKPTSHHGNIYTSPSPLNNIHPNQFQNKSNNKTREDLEALIEGIPFPNDDLSFTSFNSGHSSNTPQKFNPHYQTQNSNHHHQNVPDDRKPPTLKAPKGFSNENRQSQSHFPGHHKQKGSYLDFNRNNNYEENPKAETLSDWTKHHVTPSTSNMLFPQVTAPTMEITGEGSFSQSIGRKGPFGFGKSSVNQNNHISIDDLDDKEIENEEPSAGLDNARVLNSVGDSLLRIEAKRCQDQLATVESELVFQKKKYTKLEQENNYLTQRMNDLEDQLQFVQEKYNDHSSLDTLRGRNLANAKTQLKQVKGLLEKKEEKVEELALQVQQLKKNEQIYKEAVEKEISNLKLEIERGKILVKANQDKANELELKQKETFESNMMVEHQKDHIIENLKSQVEDQRERIEELKSHVQKNKGTMEKLAMHVHEREELLNKATEELEEKEKEVEMLKKHNENFLMDQHRLTNLESDKVWEQKYSALNDELVRIKSEKDREIMRLKEMTARMKEQLRIAEETIIKKDEEINMSMAQGRPSARNFNVLDSLLEGDGNRAKDDELRNQKAHFERQISLYRSQIEELNQKLAAFENEAMFSGRNPQAHYSRLSVGSTRDDKMTISQSTNCTLYLEPLNNLMSALKIYNSGSSDVNYEEELGRVVDHFNQLTSRAQTLEKTIVEFKKKQISVNSELDCVKMENDQLKETLGDMQEKEAENAEKIISLHSEIADLKKTVISLESQTRTGSLFGGSPRSTRSRRDNDLFKDHDEENLQEHLQLKEDYKTLESEYSTAKDNVKKLQMKCKEMELELKRASSQNERSQNELELIKVELETKSTNERNHWEGIRKGLNERIKGLETKNESIMEEARKRDLTIAELQGKLEVAEVESKTGRKDVSYASESGVNKDVLSNRVTQLEKRNKDLDSELQEKEEEINNFRLMLKEANYELEQEKTGNAENLKRMQNKVRSLEEDVANYKHESETLAEQLNRLNEILEKRDVELNRVLNEKQALQFENERLGMGLDKEKSREDVLGKMNDALSSRDKQLIELKGKVEDLTFELKKEKEKNQKLRDTENGRERQLEDITSRLKEKENEIKYVVESAKKKETHDAKTTTELNTKKQEFEKLQAAHSQLEKELEALKKERNELKKTSEIAQKSLEKLEAEMKRKEESLKQVDEKTKRDAQYLKDKDKANLELFKVNKNLTENLKTLEETHNTLKIEFEKKNKTLAQKLSEIKGLTQSNKKFEESNQELTNEVMDLKVQLQQLENEIANKKVQALKNENLDESLSRYIDDKEVTRETTRTAATKRETEQDGGKSNRQEIEKLLQSFSEKEAQFENIKNSFIEKMMGLSEKCTSLAEENSFLSQKIEVYQTSNETLKDKVTKLEKNIKQGTTWTPFNDSGIEFNKMDTRTDPLASLRKTQGALEEYDDDGYGLDELKPPRDYDANPMKYASYNKNDYDMKSTVNRYDEKATTNVFNNNILEMISPEMLSTDETVCLMLEVLRRASQSHDLAVTIGTNREFKELTNAIRKQCTLEEQNVYAYENNNNVSFSGKIRRQNRHNESYYSYSKQG